MTPLIVPVDAPDYRRLAAFLSAFPGESRTERSWADRLSFWWDRNPAVGVAHRGWVLEDAGRIVGFIGVVPTLFQLAGRAACVFSGTTWRVLPEYRALSMSLLTRQIAVARDSVLFATTSEDHTLKMRRALGFQPLPRATSGRSIAVINAQAVAKRALRSVVGASFLASALAPVLKTVDGVPRLGSVASDVETELFLRATDAFDDLWQRTGSLFRNTNLRTSEWINWYCFGCQSRPKALIGAVSRGRLVGYAVWRLEHDDAEQLRKLECLDLWADRSVLGVTAALVGAGVAHARSASADLIGISHFDLWVETQLKGLGMWTVSIHERQDYYRISSSLAFEMTESNSYFVAQGDNGL
jgi:hypothetical protein